MKKSMRIRKKNPFYNSFLSVVIICCVVLNCVFFYISYRNENAAREKYAREKAEQAMVELETQLQSMREVAMRAASNYKFHPSYFKGNIVNEFSMLQNFVQYKYYIALTNEYFLDYGEKWIYYSSGTTSTLDLFMQSKSKNEEEHQRFRKELEELRKGLTEICGYPKVLSIFNEIYVLIPFRVSGDEQCDVAVLGFVVEKSALEKRFQLAGAGMEGGMTLYGEDGVLYSNQEELCSADQKNVFTAVSQNEVYTFCYQPESEYNTWGGLFLVVLVLALVDLFLVLIIANLYAMKTYEPIRVLTDVYREKVSDKESQYESGLGELEYIMDNMLQHNIEANLQIQENQKIMRNQILRIVMENSASTDVLSYLDKVDICLPGPLYCVLSISFEEEAGVTKDFLESLQEELEQVSCENEKEYVYTICSLEGKVLNVLCSVYKEERKDELIEAVCDVAESYIYKPMIGIGNVYRDISNLSASWLESMDELQDKKRRRDEKKGKEGFVYRVEELRRISAALESGNEVAAKKRLRYFIEGFGEKPVSILMLQYILADFLGEMRMLGEKYGVEVSKQNVSQLVSVRSVQNFEKVAKHMIHEFCENYESIRSRKKENGENRIYEYINEHFTEYDISIESVAANLHTSAETVRQAVLRRTGKLYRDYLIYLRIEYAKELLRKEDMPIAEVCTAVGYGNVSYFIKLFRENVGITPSKYRRNTVDM